MVLKITSLPQGRSQSMFPANIYLFKVNNKGEE